MARLWRNCLIHTIRKLKPYLPYLLTASALSGFGWYLYNNVERYKQLFDFSLGSLLFLAVLGLAVIVIHGFINYLLYHRLGAPVTLHEGVGLAAINTFANLLPFTGGMVAKAVFLKQKYKLSYGQFLSATVALYNCFLATNGFIGLIILAFWRVVKGYGASDLLIIAFAIMILTITFLWLPWTTIPLPSKWQAKLVQLSDGWQILGQDWKLTAQLVLLQILLVSLFAGRFWVSFRLVSQNVTFTQCVLFSAATILTRLVGFMPDGLGVREAIVASVAGIIGFDVGVSVVAVGIDRLVSTLLTVALGVTYTHKFSQDLVSSLGNVGVD